MTQKLSGSSFVNEFNVVCAPTTYKNTFPPYRLKVFSINPVDIINYPEGINANPGDILYEFHHKFLTTNDSNWEPPFDEGEYIELYGFVEIGEVDVDPLPTVTTLEPAFVDSVPLTGTFKIIKSNTTSTILKLSAKVENEIAELGYMYYTLPYRMKAKSSLGCIIPKVLKPTVEVNFDTLELSWAPNSNYTIEVGDGFVNHLYGGQYGNPTFTVPFTTNANPSVSEYYPTSPTESFNWHKANKLIQLTYTNSPMLKGNGNINLYQVNPSGPDTLLTTFTLPGDSRVTVNSNTYKIDINSLGYIKENSTYYLTIDGGALKDYDGFQSTAVSDSTTIRFETDEIHFPGLKSSISMFSALNDIGLRLRRNSIFANVVASLSAIGGRFKVAFSNQTSSFTISPVLLRLRRFISSLSSSVTVSMDSTNSRKRGLRGAFSSAFTLPLARFIDFITINPSSSITDPTTTNYTYQYDPRDNGFAADVKNTASYIASSAPYEWVFQPSYIAAANNVFGKGKVYVYNSSDNSLAISFTNPDPAPGFDMAGGAYPGVENVNKFRTFGEKIAIYGDLIIISAEYWASTSSYGLLNKIFVYSISTGALQASWSLPSQQPQNVLQDINEISCNGTHITITTKIGYYIYQVSDYSLVQYNSTETFCTGRLYGNYFVYNSQLPSQWKISVYNMTTQTVLYTKGIAQVGPGWTASSDKLFLSKWDGNTDSQYINVYNLSTGVLISTIDKHQGEYLRQTGTYGGPLGLISNIYFATASTVFAGVDIYPVTQGSIPSPSLGIFGYNISTGLLTHAITSYGYGSISGNQLVLADGDYQATPSSPYGRILRYTVPN